MSVTSPILITAPTAVPISLQEIKDQLRITWDGENNKLLAFRETAREEFEKLTNRTLNETTWEWRLENWPCGEIVLPRGAPLISVISVKYLDSDGAETSWSSSEYVVESRGDRNLGRIAPASGQPYPSFTPFPLNPIRIQYKAGIENAASPQQEIPGDVKTCLLLMIGGLWEHREEFIVAERSASVIFAANPTVMRMITNLRASHAS